LFCCPWVFGESNNHSHTPYRFQTYFTISTQLCKNLVQGPRSTIAVFSLHMISPAWAGQCGAFLASKHWTLNCRVSLLALSAFSVSPEMRRGWRMALLRSRGDNFAISRSLICFTNALTVPKIPDLDCLHEFNACRSFIVRVADFFCADPTNFPQARWGGLYPIRLAKLRRVDCSAIGSSLDRDGDSSGAPWPALSGVGSGPTWLGPVVQSKHLSTSSKAVPVLRKIRERHVPNVFGVIVNLRNVPMSTSSPPIWQPIGMIAYNPWIYLRTG
jgi:hypothetical protein